MFRFVVLAFLLAVVGAGPITDDLTSVDLDVLAVDSIDRYFAVNPEVKSFGQLKRDVQNRQQIVYRLGQRVSGDRLVANNNYSNQWAKPQDVNARLNYPASGIGSIVTYLAITVDQSNSLGRAVVVGGGIGQRTISILIEARNTTIFRYNAQIFGYN